MASGSTFRYDINALRAIAVLGVVLFHYKVPFFDGGFAGVDVFFIISGYLMTKIVVTGLEKGSFSLVNFYAKRAQRIIPALNFLIAVLLLFAFFFYLPDDYQSLAKNALASVFFYSNIAYYDANYFDASSDTNMLLHTWSLSVEWQFYLLLPLVLLILNKFYRAERKFFLYFFLSATALIFLIAAISTRFWPNASFYLLPTRSWELLLGGVVFLAEGRFKFLGSRIAMVAGYVAIFLCFYLLNNRMNWPGIYTLLPVSATFLVISANFNDVSILRSRIVEFLGKISYSLYLWHWPIYVVGGYLGIKLDVTSTVLYIAVSLGAAYLSYTYIESIKFKGNIMLSVSTGSLACVAILISHYSINEVVFEEKSLAMSRYDETHQEERNRQFGIGSCFMTAHSYGPKNFKRDFCLSIKDNKKNYILIGDSHSAHLSQSLREYFQKLNVNLNQASASGCLPLLKPNGEARCRELMNFLYHDYLPKHAKEIDGVVISGNWVGYASKEVLLTDIQETLQYFKKLNLKVILIGQNETYTIPFSSIAARECEMDTELSYRYLDDSSLEVNDFLKSNLASMYVNIYDLNIPKISADNVPYMFDQNHFTKYGADRVAIEIFRSKQFRSFLK
ncbi:hypothetical protein DYBT9623_03957 [Dyadobacter sp. CECT 9623]|uniref:Acyltransferase n=1 Tax=Dyadobacter linearis TaxID=2823330 RepID=A0ABN7RB33_9BACT|nr:acyltransferase family protein [Dyadobacter sp. CECT 9623]CAG5072018.1 hypothetical protein DYBT9623_03957 [Dyadobacter sp. CECT 9623]